MSPLRSFWTNFRTRDLLWGVIWGSLAAAMYGVVRESFSHGISMLKSAAELRLPVSAPILLASVAVLILILPAFSRKTVCLVRSWRVGLVRGTTFLWGLCALLSWLDHRRAPLFIIAAMAGEIVTDLRDPKRHKESYSAQNIASWIPSSEKSGLADVGFDKPIQNWSQDAIGRREFVGTLLTRALVDCEPAIGICADFGEGKSSVLHLIENTIRGGGRAIAVPFRTWLPGSEEKLLDSLFGTATSAIRQKYFLAAWRPVLSKYAKALVGAIPKSWAFFGDFLPPQSQAEQINELTSLFSRLPVRVVFLLDEVDRMHEEELRVLLKILRGAPELTNVSYICAFSKEAIARLISPADVQYGCHYLDKFFPVQLQLPRIDADLRERLFSARLSDVLESENVVSSNAERKKFEDARNELWHGALKDHLTNFRMLGQLLRAFENSLHVLKNEVNVFDLLVIESVRMLLPSTYEFIYKNGRYFHEPPGGIERWNRTQEFGIDKEGRKKAIAAGLQDHFESLPPDDRNLAVGLLVRVFPSVKEYAKGKPFRVATIYTPEEKRRISDPNFFPRYFEYSVPATMFGEKAMDDFLLAISGSDQHAIIATLEATLPGSEPDDLRRIHFFRRLRERVSDVPYGQVRFLAIALAKLPSGMTSDYIAYLVLKDVVLALVARFQGTPELQETLSEIVRVASTDRFASDIVYDSVSARDNADAISNWQGFDSEAIKKVFGERMRLHHLRPVAALLPAAADDVLTFVRWKSYVPDDVPYIVDYFKTAFDYDIRNVGIFLHWLLPGNVSYDGGSPIKFVEGFYTPICDIVRRLKNAERDSVQWTPEEGAAIQRFWEFLKAEPELPGPTTPAA